MTDRIASDRIPADAAALFNPAYCAAILHKASSGFQATKGTGFPYALGFIALPLVLHPASAERLPSSSKTRLHGWLLGNPDVMVGLAERARSLAPFVREAIAFGLRAQIFQLSEPDMLVPLSSTLMGKWDKRPYNSLTAKRALVLGKLLSQVNEVSTVFTLFGLRP
jgi:hypothetical protein